MKLHFGIVGFGHIGRKHLASIQKHTQAVVVAICDPNVTQSDIENIPVYSDIHTMLSHHPEIEVVNICTPNGLHATNAIACISEGKHVVVEKPICLTKKDAESLIFHALNKHVKVFCVMQNRYTSNARFLKQLIETNNLGYIHEIDVQLVWNRDKRYYLNPDGSRHSWRGSLEYDGGPLFTQFSHFVDLLYWLFGDLTIGYAQKYNVQHPYVPEIEDSGLFTFRTESGAHGVFNYSINAPYKNLISRVSILGEKGVIEVSGQYLEVINQYYSDNLLENQFPILDNSNTHSLVIKNVIEAINSGNNIDTNAMEGLKIVEIIENVYRQ
jgi:UDP-N-acetyl-2-amino-2-deoxyglucuronate dehydrogenase